MTNDSGKNDNGGASATQAAKRLRALLDLVARTCEAWSSEELAELELGRGDPARIADAIFDLAGVGLMSAAAVSDIVPGAAAAYLQAQVDRARDTTISEAVVAGVSRIPPALAFECAISFWTAPKRRYPEATRRVASTSPWPGST